MGELNMTVTVAKNGEPLLLTWEMVHDKYTNLIKYMAGNYARNNSLDGMISAEDLYQEGVVKMYDCWVIWCLGENKDFDEFGPILKTSLQRCLYQTSKKRVKTTTSEEALLLVKDDSIKDTTDVLYKQEGLRNLHDSLSPTAQELLKELISPSDKTLYEVWADIARKNMLKSQGKRVNIPKDNTVRMKHIIRAIGITGKQYDIALKEIREKAPSYLEM